MNYRRLLSLISDGGPWFTTDYIPTATTKIVMDMFLVAPYNSYDTPFGSRSASDIFVAYNGGMYRFIWGNINQNVSNISGYYNRRVKMYLSNTETYVDIDGIKVAQSTYTASNNNMSVPIGVFTLQTGINSDLGSCRCRGKLYGLKIYENDTLVREYVPAYNLDTNSYGVVEIFTDSFYGNLGSGTFSGEEIPNAYTIAFNANGGSGTMNEQIVEYGVPTPLNTNQFTRENYAFAGWALSPTGTVVYYDGAVVDSIAAIGETITLYAIWTIPPMQILIQRNDSEKNRVDKNVVNLLALSGSLRNETSILDPVILVSGNLETFAGANYLTIPKFKRKYFITNIRAIRTGIVEISAHVDVLSSFANEIRENRAIVHKQENEWNLYLNDGTFKVYSNPIIETYLFPVSFPGTFSYVLAVAGGGNNANE